MKKHLLITVSAILWISLSSTVFAGTCTDRGYSVDSSTDNMCTTIYNSCKSNYTTDMALPSEVPAYINTYCTESIGIIQSYDATDAAYCMAFTLYSAEAPLIDVRDGEYCFAAQACIAEQWQDFCDEEARLCCEGGDSTTPPVDPDPDPDPSGDGTTPPVDPDPSDGFLYKDDNYGFSLTLPQEWATHTLTKAVEANITHFSFYMRSGSDLVALFSIGITTGSTPEMEEYLGENNYYKFSFSHLNGDPPSDLLPRVLELDQIKQSFATHTASVAPSVSSTFSDTFGHQYEDAITYVKDQGIVIGYSDGTYKPNNPINRAEFIKIIMEAGFEDSVFGGSNCFTDVGTEWFAEYVCAAKDYEIILGYPNGSFGPANSIILAEALKIIFETAASMSGDIIEPTPEGPWYQIYMDLANSVNLLMTINAEAAHDLTRGEMAELIYIIDSM